jgi:hypothetical protein
MGTPYIYRNEPMTRPGSNYVYIGVDHGEKGALAALDWNGDILDHMKMPIKDDKIDCFQIYSWLYENWGDYDEHVVVCGERLHAIFKAAASSTFSFGKNVGKIVGIIECLQMEYHEVRAVDWQDAIFEEWKIDPIYSSKRTPSGKLRKDTKAMAAVALEHLHGNNRDFSTFVKHDGLVDALLIAEYARRNIKPTGEAI